MKYISLKILSVFSIFLLNSQLILAESESFDNKDTKIINSVIKNFTAQNDDFEEGEIVLKSSDGFDIDKNKVTNGEIAKQNVPGLDLNLQDESASASASEFLSKAYEAFQLGHYEVALMFYTKAEAIEPKNDDIMFGMAVTHHKLGHLSIAKDYYGKILETYPNHKFALNNFLNILSYEKPDVALTTLRRLEAAEPSLAVIPAQIAVTYERQKDFKNAIKYFKKANKLDPSNLDYIYNLAVLFERIEQRNNAVTLYNRIMIAMDKGYKANISLREVRSRVNNLTLETKR